MVRPAGCCAIAVRKASAILGMFTALAVPTWATCWPMIPAWIGATSFFNGLRGVISAFSTSFEGFATDVVTVGSPNVSPIWTSSAKFCAIWPIAPLKSAKIFWK